ncbi:MAG: hypothetical protein KC493_08670 [Bacteriovoracaceae bacterium]|nr:hypothetical protein [Bacteriovoracaceae bacterium]
MIDTTELVLSHLSFFEPMTKGQLIFDMDEKELKLAGNFSLDELELTLTRLESEGLVKRIKAEEDTFIRINPNTRTWWQRLYRKIFS